MYGRGLTPCYVQHDPLPWTLEPDPIVITEREHAQVLDQEEYFLKFMCPQKQIITFLPSANDCTTKVKCYLSQGRLLVNAETKIAPKVHDQILQLDYHLFRYTAHGNILVILPMDIDDITFKMSSKDSVWTIDELDLPA